MNRNDIMMRVSNERDYQDQKWGTAFDDKNTVNDWCAYIASYTGRASKMGATKDEQIEGFIKVAALAVAAAEAAGRNDGFPPRHYDASTV